ncbi:putative elongator complex protein 1 [Amphiura filiformis]|uniref:putative elongator complex protein 1 n=1 Tax=Amphiura filiformis TaxID=82378 RepID=UPI003B220951
MRNLELVQCHRIQGIPELKHTSCISVDCDTGRVYLATDDGSVVCLDPQAQQVQWHISLVEQGYLTVGDSTGHIIDIQHLPDQMSVCMATSNGDVLLYNTVVFELECVGSVASGLTSMTWSPDQELVVLTTGADTIILMTKEFDPVIETTMNPEEFGEQKPITVGWGKKETQFHGSEGKQAATKKAEEVKPALPWDDLKVRVSWRGDGQYFVVSAVNQQSGARKLRTWNRECVLQFTSEDVNGLEQALCWKPSGSVIASSQRLPHQHDIVFFEKNGLRHGEFTLPFDKMQVKVNEVSWNSESSVLAVLLQDLPQTVAETSSDGKESEVTPKSYIQLWTVGNYHWYLKQSLHFPACHDEKIVAMHWDPEHAYRLHVVCQGGQYLQYTWSWATNCSVGQDSLDNANVAVIDGKQVLITPFRRMVVPPPMAAYSLQLAGPVNQVLFAPPLHSNDIATLMEDGRIAFYRARDDTDGDSVDGSIKLMAAGGNGFKVRVKPPVFKGVYSIVDDSGKDFTHEYPLHLHHFCWMQPDTIVAASTDAGGAGTTLYHMTIKDEEKQLAIRSQDTIFGEVFRICSHHSTGRLAIQLADGSVVDTDNQPITQLPQPCVHMAMCTIGGQDVVLGLTERYRFYVNDTEVASDCTSFLVHDEFLLLTTHSHTCRAISLNTSLNDLYSLSQGKSVSVDETIRRVERGSRIVTAVPDHTKLILQMPRGNLETIHPRPLVLSAVKKLLDKLEFQKAFDILQRHRISMNIICDHNPKTFLETLDIMVTQLDSANNLNLFLADLKEEDVTETMYSAAYRGVARDSKTVYKSNKVDVICDAVRESIQRVDAGKFFLSTLTTHVKKNTPELETALQKIQMLRDNPSGLDGAPSADEALKYILYLVDVNQLFDVALGTYDFSLVIMVAEKSQKDPKEYLPFLNHLQRLETNYQCYSIDRHLKRYSKALQHIAKCPNQFIECLALVREHKLYSQAMDLFPKGSVHFKEIVNAYAEYLTEKQHTSEAALMYTLCDQWEQALELYKLSGHWQQAFCMAGKLGFQQDQIAQLANSIAVYLINHSRRTEAANVLLEYTNNVEEAIVTLIAEQQWDEALRVMHKYNRTDFVETNLKPALTESFSMHIASLENYTTVFERHKSRLAVVRQLKEQARLEMLEGDVNDTNADLYSDTSSMTGSVTSSRSGMTGSVTSSRSGYSAYTAYSSSTAKIAGRSSKNRRKAERKKHSLREGSALEDVALLEALGTIIRNVDNLKGDVGKLLSALVLHGYRPQALQLQRLLGDTLKMMEKSIPEIWQPEMENFPMFGQSFGPQSTSAAIAAAAINQGGARKLPSPDDIAIFVPPKISKDETWKMHVLDTR